MNTEEISVKMAMDRWEALNKNFDKALDALTDEQLQNEIAPGRNRGIYLLGHLIAVHDDMLRLLDMGDKQYPQYFNTFIESPDKTVDPLPSAKELRAQWKEQLEDLDQKFKAVQTHEWFEKHTAVSAEDFAREPHRNKLNIIITRSSHLSYHWGQFILIK